MFPLINNVDQQVSDDACFKVHVWQNHHFQ